MASDPRILTWQGRGLKLDTKEDVEKLLVGVDPTVIEEIHLGGNTLGVDASKAFAEFLSKAQRIKVCLSIQVLLQYSHRILRLQILQISSLGVLLQRFLWP